MHSSSSSSAFEKISNSVFGIVLTQQAQALVNQSLNIQDTRRRDFVLSTWTNRTTGGLRDQDRVLLARLYREANSVFEYGLGESTYIANYVGVPRYAGIDSSVEWIDTTRKKVSSHFRFYYGDTGDIGDWGFPADPLLAKSAWQYQLAPLQSELEPFDVYMVDGRWRVACSLASFLHASARGARHSGTIVLIHDCFQPKQPPPVLERKAEGRNYHVNDDILELVEHSQARLCVYKRKENTTDDLLLERYHEHRHDFW